MLVGVLLAVLVVGALSMADDACVAYTLADKGAMPESEALATLGTEGVGRVDKNELPLSVEVCITLLMREELLVGAPAGI